MEHETVKTAASGLVPFAFVVIMVAYILGPGSDMLELGVSLPEINIEQVVFTPDEIHATVRNTGPIPVEIVMADINDRIQPAAVEPDGVLQRYETALVRIPFAWNEAEPYTVGITVSDGTRFEKSIESAAPAQTLDADFIWSFAIIGTYVGIIPVMIGLLWFPFIRKLDKKRYGFFLALTVGLLVFLAIDSIEEATQISGEFLGDSFGGMMLVVTTVSISFLALYYSGSRFVGGAKSRAAGPVAVGLMISIGIGLHNFGEGLAVGASVGLGSAFGAFLIVGFALHNTTEGIAIAAPMSRTKLMPFKLAAMGAIAGAPAIFGAWIGGAAFSPVTSVIFLAVGAGAIFQVTLTLLQWIRQDGDGFASVSIVGGFAAGMIVMYLTSILV